VAEEHVKRTLDIVAALCGLLLLGPVLLVVAVLVRLKLGSPVIFAQDRPGLGGRTFRLYKFRTMTNERDEGGVPLPDTERLTDFGRALRGTSIDELPELWNVLIGDMSLVGPRPLAIEYLDRYTDEQLRRHDVRPGITGLAQVSGRNDLAWDKRLKLDTWYVDNHSLWLDLRILVRTLVKVFRREGASRPGQSDMPDFRNGHIPGGASSGGPANRPLIRQDGGHV